MDDYLAGPLEVISRHPPLAADLARRFTDAPLPAPAETVVNLTENPYFKVLVGESYVPAIKAAVYTTLGWSAGDSRAEARVTIAAPGDRCVVSYCRGPEGEESTPVEIGSDSGAQLADGGPWMDIFAGIIGATDLNEESNRRAILDAIDATGGNPTGVLALTTLVMRAATARTRAKLEADMGTRPSYSLGFTFAESAFNDGYVQGLQRGRKETAIVMALTERGLALTDEQRRHIATCSDPDRLARWFSRALTAATAGEVLAG